LDALRILRIAARQADRLAAAAEVALLDRGLEDEALDPREARRELERVWRASRLLLDLELFLEVTERLDAVGRAFDLERVERVALGNAELAADDLVLGQRVAVDVHPLDQYA